MGKREKKPEKKLNPPHVPVDPPKPTVVAVRYCLKCGKLQVMVLLAVEEAMAMRSVGCVLSGCCRASTALLLVPFRADQDIDLPPVIPEITRINALGPEGVA